MRPFLAACVLFFASAAMPALAQSPSATTAMATTLINGRVLDQSTGLPIAGASVETIGATKESAATDSNGRFSISSLVPGRYQLRVGHHGYQTAISDSVLVTVAQGADVTLVLARQSSGATDLRTIGHTSTRASQALQRSSVIYQSVSAETIQNLGFFRTGDYLRTLPQINMAVGTTGGSDTPSPGDDQYLDFRGIGNLETTTLLDGHPIGGGLNRGKNFGYNWESSPTFALRDVVVVYGSGLTGLSPYSALGGVANMVTLDPTPRAQWSFTQGYGTFSKLATTITGTGMLGQHFGYAVAYGDARHLRALPKRLPVLSTRRGIRSGGAAQLRRVRPRRLSVRDGRREPRSDGEVSVRLRRYVKAVAPDRLGHLVGLLGRQDRKRRPGLSAVRHCALCVGQGPVG